MKTVEQMIEELSKFPKDAMCWAKDEINSIDFTGLVIEYGAEKTYPLRGVIFCAECTPPEKEEPTEVFGLE